MSNKIKRLKEIAAELREMFPGKVSIMLDAQLYAQSLPTETLVIHGVKTYAECTELFRSFGIGQRNKTPFLNDTIGAYTQVSGTVDGFNLTAYPDELPPSCHIEKITEKIPKQQTVDTGEFIEVERQKVVCSHEFQERLINAAAFGVRAQAV